MTKPGNENKAVYAILTRTVRQRADMSLRHGKVTVDGYKTHMIAFSVQVVLIKVTSGHSRITTKVDLKKITPDCKT